jgi:hypothetical protein
MNYEKATSDGGLFPHSYPILGSYLRTIRPNTEPPFDAAFAARPNSSRNQLGSLYSDEMGE